jgi:hypothetical protein
VILSNDARDMGQLLSYSLRPKMRPGVEGEYGRLLRRYQDEMSFRDAFNDLLEGMQLRVLHAGELGVVLAARRESVFAYRLASDQGSSNRTHNALRGLAHIGIAAYAYPHPDDLTDTTVRYVDVMAVEEFIRRACTRLKARADEIAQGRETSDRVVDLALAAGLGTVWSEWDQMQAIDIGARGRGAGRISTKCTTYWVLRACKDLVDHGLARAVGKDTDGRFQLLERFRHHVATDAGLEGYQALTTLARTDSELPDPHDTATARSLPGRPPAWVESETATAGDASRDSSENARDEATAGSEIAHEDKEVVT